MKGRRGTLYLPEADVSITARFNFVNTLHRVYEPQEEFPPEYDIISLEWQMTGTIPL